VWRGRAGRAAEIEHQVHGTMASIDLFAIEPSVLGLAAELEPASTGTLDAIHVATALALAGRIEAFVSYDIHQLEAARLAGLPTASPGAGA
jgi:predicted nucleic acid-binding protein